AELIVTDTKNNWEELFIKVESHHYFQGQIGFIFKLVNNQEDYIEFQEVSSKVSKVFSPDVLAISNLLFRSFLTLNTCFFQNGNKLTYPFNESLTLRARNENWRRFLAENIELVKKMIDDIDTNCNDIVQYLKERIQKYLDLNSTQDYVFKIIANEKLLKYSLKNNIRQYNHAYYLLSTTRIYSFFAEIFTYDWFLLNNDDNKYEYHFGKNEGSIVGIKKKEDTNVIFYDIDTGKFKITQIENLNSSPEYFETIDEAIQKLN
ncbi:MAG: hypothetical protein GY827_08940, partial [Cytophagales bacterium]|nr:hypothetical protein [Cytophagales bacterium]